jgi:hypothetical protein
MTTSSATPQQLSQLCLKFLGEEHALHVCESAAGYYIGVISVTEGPLSRDSVEYFVTYEEADAALASGEWTQRLHP